MAQTRYVTANIICGKRGTGKSTFTKKIVEHRPKSQPNALIYLEQINIDERTFDPFPVVSPITEYRGGVALVNRDEIGIISFLNRVNESFRDGIVVIDEAGMYSLMRKNKETDHYEPIEPLKLILKNMRKYNVSIFFTYHGVSEFNVQMLKYMDNIILFHQTDKFSHKAGVIPHMDELVAAQERIRAKFNSGNFYYNEAIKL